MSRLAGSAVGGPARRSGPGPAPGAAEATLVQPRFMARFACLGDACPDTCCRGWTIEVDQATARRHRAHPDPVWRARLADALIDERRPGRPPRTRLRLDSGGCCPLLRTDGLCSVHAELGEGWLAPVCRTFPRLDGGSGPLRHRTGSIACVEVARRVLVEPDALLESPEGNACASGEAARGGDVRATGPTLTDLEAARVRSTVLRLLARHDLPWSARVALFCVTLEDLGRVDLVRRRRALDDLLVRTEAVLAHADVGGFDAVFPSAPERSLAALAPILRVLVEVGAGDSPIAPTLRALTAPLRTRSGFGDTTVEALAAGHARAASGTLGTALAARPHLIGNLYGAALLHERFPFGRPQAAVDAAWNAAFFLAMWKVLTVGAMGIDGRDFETIAVEVAYRLGRTLAHWPAAKDLLRRDLERRGARTAAVLACLLR